MKLVESYRMEVFNKIFQDRRYFEATHDDSNQPMAMGKSKSYALSILNDELESASKFYTQEDRKCEKDFLKKLIANKGNEQHVVEFQPELPSRRPGEFIEVDFPKVSVLTWKQMKFYTILSQAKKNNRLDPNDEAEFEELSNALNNERTEYQSFARHQWFTKNHLRLSEIKPSVKSYIDDVWQSRIRRLQKYPKYYRLHKAMIPLNFNDVIDTENPVTLKMGSILFATGVHNSFVVPPLQVHPREVTYLPTDYQTLTESRDPDYEFLPPVSQDNIVEQLLNESAAFKNEHTVVVLSGSGLKTIVDNHTSNLSLNWMLPITIKEYTVDGNKKRKVVYIDKKLPPTNLSIVQRMQWYAKIAIRMMMCKSNEKSDEAEVNPSTSWDRPGGSGSNEKDEEGDVMDVEDDSIDPISRCKVKRKPVWSAGHRVYRVWQVGKETQNHLMKNQAGEIKILLRTKYDGIWVRQHLKKAQLFTLAPKLDYQCEYGGDMLTSSEFIRQWTDMHIRPGSFLKRARINPLTSELMQLQTVSEANMLADMGTTYSISHHSIANILYSVTSKLVQLPPGRYILGHSTKNGAFCTLHEACEENAPKPFELQKMYPKQASQAVPLELSAPFIHLDPKYRTPNCCYRSVLPLTFPPRANTKPALKPEAIKNALKSKTRPNFVPGKKKKKKKKNKNKKPKKRNENTGINHE